MQYLITVEAITDDNMRYSICTPLTMIEGTDDYMQTYIAKETAAHAINALKDKIRRESK